MSKYFNPYTDFGFKKLFGTELNKDLLISFLNALFEKNPKIPHDEITDITYLNSEQLGRTAADRKAIFDVYCTTKAATVSLLKCRMFFSSFSRTEAFIIRRFRFATWQKKTRTANIGIMNFKRFILSAF